MEDGFPKLTGNPYVQNLIGMSAIGAMMVVMTRTFGHPYVDGVGYGVIQSVLNHSMTSVGLLALLFGLKLLATTISLGCGASGGIFSPSLFLGATLGAAFAGLMNAVMPGHAITLPSAAIVGMAAIVGAGTGGVMTAIIMIFEMTRDYAIIVPVIVSVAIAAGIRRLLIDETIYTIKLRHRGHRIPKERHVNLFLVKHARDIMEHRFVITTTGTALKDVIAGERAADLSAIIVERNGHIIGLIPPRSGLWREAGLNPEITVDSFMEKRLVLARDVDSLSTIFARLRRHRAGAAIVFEGSHRPLTKDLVGIITKRAIADTIIDSYDD
jgi:CIC family chloride channel protein